MLSPLSIVSLDQGKQDDWPRVPGRDGRKSVAVRGNEDDYFWPIEHAEMAVISLRPRFIERFSAFIGRYGS